MINQRLPLFVKFGSWVGADRDGNPFVTCEVTKKTAGLHRRLIFRTYRTALEDLIRRFSQSETRVKVSKKLKASIHRDQRLMKEQAKELKRYEMNEFYRKKLSFIHEKLDNTYREKSPRYMDPAEFVEDLVIVQESLESNKGLFAASGDLDWLIVQARSFGFFLARLDFRDHAKKIRQALREILPETPFESDAIVEKLLLPPVRVQLDKLSSEARDILEQLDTLREIKEHDPRLARDYIISMTESPADIWALFYLARLRGLIEIKDGKITESGIAVVPLFETIGSLDRAHEVMEALYSIPLYKSYLDTRDGIQEVMLGYSDSSKDGGYFTANWKLHATQKRVAEASERHGVGLRFFHGKGGTIDRGGGESHRAIIAQPYAAVGGRLKITEQGEVVSQKYDNPVIADRNLQQLVAAVMWTNLVSKDQLATNKKIPLWEERMSILSNYSFTFYRNLVFENKDFFKFYTEVTPISVLQMTRIGSRPTMRSQKSAFEELRAIPWVFSWVQSRYIISAWYGIGHALETYLAGHGEDGLKELREMYDEWAFFRSLINNSQVSLSKADIRTASHYAALAEEGEAGKALHEQIAAEYERACRNVLLVSSQKQLLDFNPVLKESIRLRNPYIDPLHYIQLRFLREHRQGANMSGVRRQKTDQILLLTVNGIASGMKSTG